MEEDASLEEEIEQWDERRTDCEGGRVAAPEQSPDASRWTIEFASR